MSSENKSIRIKFAGSYFVSLMSIMLVLFVLGLYAFLMVYAGRLSNYIKENIGFEIVIKKDTKESSILKLQDELKRKKYIKSAEYVSQKMATKRLEEDLGENYLQWLGDVENPLLPSIDVRFEAGYANNDSMAKVEKWLMTKSIVKEVCYQKTLTDTVNTNIYKIKTILLFISLILIIVAVTLISHTVRLSIYSKRFLVRSMQLVGATRGFIIKPFLKTFTLQGFIGSVMALVLITIVLFGVTDYIPGMDLLQKYEYIVAIYAGVIMLSLILTILSTVFSVRKYLNADIDKLYV